MKKEIPSAVTNQKRTELVYQAVITLEAQNWTRRNSQNSLDVAINILESIEEAIHNKYSDHEQGGRNE